MARSVMSLLGLACVLLLPACSGNAVGDREAAAKGGITVKPACDSPAAGVPCTMRFFDDGSSSPNGDIVKWEWKIGGGGWVDYTATAGEAWAHFDKPGTVVAHLRVTDAAGFEGTEKAKLSLRYNNNAEPVLLVDLTDTEVAGGGLRYHQWLWNSSRSYDPDDADWGIEHGMLEISGGDLDGDGAPDVVLRCGSDDPRMPDIETADLDGDGDVDASCGPHVQPHQFQVDALAKGKEDVYVWKLTSTDAAGKKYTKSGHVTLMK